MDLKKFSPIVTTDKLGEVKAYYQEYFDFRVVFENENYLALRGSGEGGVELSFMKPSEAELPFFAGGGLIYCFEVEDVDAEHDRLRKAGLTMVQPPQDNPWGDRSAITIDPVGINIYLFKPIPPAAEFETHIKE